jgi:predicted transcriptional regulator
MEDGERDSEGKITRQFSDEDFLRAIREHEPASTMEVANSVGCTRRNAEMRLKQLEREDRVRRKKAGNSLIWMTVGEK